MSSSSLRKVAVLQRNSSSSLTGSGEPGVHRASVTGIKRADSNSKGFSGSARDKKSATQNHNADKSSETGVGLSLSLIHI